jgi:lipid-A-disaccharide synthase
MLLSLPPGSRVLALLPGSRAGEIRRLLPDFLAAAAIVAREFSELQIVIPAANAACRNTIDECLASTDRQAIAGLNLHVTDGSAHEVMLAADVVLLASGTAALEALLAKRPMVVGYRIAPLTHFIVKNLGLLKVDRYSLPNVLANDRLVPELMQDDCTPENLADALMTYLADPAAEADLLPRFRSIHESLRRNASAEAANAVVELLAESR